MRRRRSFRRGRVGRRVVRRVFRGARRRGGLRGIRIGHRM